MYKIFLLPAAQKDLNDFKGKSYLKIKNKVFSLSKNPRPSGCVKLTAEEGYRIRSGNYWILYRIDDKDNTIFIYRIKHRKDAY